MSGRDRALEHLVLTELARGARHDHGEDVTPFTERITARAEHGAHLYGDTAFLAADRDNVQEGVDEAADGVMYAMFEMQVLNLDPAPADGAHLELFNACRAFTVAQLHLRRGRRIHRQHQLHS